MINIPQFVEEEFPLRPFLNQGNFDLHPNLPQTVPPGEQKRRLILQSRFRPRKGDEQIGYFLRSAKIKKAYQFKGKRALKFLFQYYTPAQIMRFDPQDLVEFLNYPELLLTACRSKGDQGYELFNYIWNAAYGLREARLNAQGAQGAGAGGPPPSPPPGQLFLSAPQSPWPQSPVPISSPGQLFLSAPQSPWPQSPVPLSSPT
jgi:hypothetical protein